MKKLNVAMIGCVEFSIHMLKELHKSKSVNIVAIVTKSKSDFNSDFFSLKDFAVKKKISFFISSGMDEKKIINFLKKFNIDIGFCIGWSHILSLKVLNIPRLGFIGYHPANLPDNRGRHPIIWAIALGLSKTASSFFMMNKFADQGAIIDKKLIYIDKKDNSKILYNKLMLTAKKQLKSILKNISTNKLKPIKQEKNSGNRWRKRSKRDGIIDWRMSYKNIENLVKALYSPYPGATSFSNNKEFIVWKVEKGEKGGENIEPGKVLKVTNKYITVKCIDYEVIIKKHNLEKLPKKGDYLL